jgi:hypothetical protein
VKNVVLRQGNDSTLSGKKEKLPDYLFLFMLAEEFYSWPTETGKK